MQRVITKQHLFNYELKHKAFLNKHLGDGKSGFFNIYLPDTSKLTLDLIDRLIKERFFDIYKLDENEVFDFIYDYKDLIDITLFISSNKLFTGEYLEFIADTFQEQLDENPLLWKELMNLFMRDPNSYNKNFLIKYRNRFDWRLFINCIFNNDVIVSNSVYSAESAYTPYNEIINKIKKYIVIHLDEILYGEQK